LGLAAILQTYTGVSDDELIEAMVMDRRWQLVLDCLDAETPPFRKPTFLAFRERMIASQMDRRGLARTVAGAAAPGAFGSRNLRAALDSSPLWGAGRVEDTYNLLGHALRKAPGVVVLSERGTPTLRDGVAPDRRMSLEDSQMRHGRKSRSQLVDGYKRHVLRDLDRGLVPAVGITPANVPEAQVTDSISLDLHAQALTLRELHIDRAYLSSHLVRERDETLEISCRAWPVRHGAQFAKTAFVLDWEQGTIQCPDGVVIPFTAGSNVLFPADRRGGCALRPGCTTSKTGRSVSIHRDERLMQELRERQLPPQGRAKLRERKNLFDLRRTAVVHNLHVIARAPAMANTA
jgi:transposase